MYSPSHAFDERRRASFGELGGDLRGKIAREPAVEENGFVDDRRSASQHELLPFSQFLGGANGANAKIEVFCAIVRGAQFVESRRTVYAFVLPGVDDHEVDAITSDRGNVVRNELSFAATVRTDHARAKTSSEETASVVVGEFAAVDSKAVDRKSVV